MERSHRFFYSLIHSKFFNRIPRFQIPSFAAKPNLAQLKNKTRDQYLRLKKNRLVSSWVSSPDKEKLKLLRGIVCLFLAIVLGWASLQASQEKGRFFFARHHWPLYPAWKETLASFQLQHQEQLSKWTTLFKTLPDAFSDSSEIWANENGCYVYLAKTPFNRDTGAEFWACAAAAPIAKWVNLGSGVEGFDRLIEFLNQHKPLLVQIAQKKPNPRRNLVDPKEIRY
jgi:hypothetical protein